MFNQLLTYLLGKNGLGIKKIEVLFVATKWDLVENVYGANINKYFRENFPQSYGRLQATRSKSLYTSFSVGEVTQNKVPGNGKITDRIKKFDFGSTDLIINWIYNAFTGRTLKGFPKLKKSLFDKVKTLLEMM